MIETATFAGGCFWGVEKKFKEVNGVTKTATGYMGGHFPNPCYLDVAARITGHAEVVQLQYNPDIVSYEQLLQVFWKIHDPTSLNRQGPDRGEQYRSAIFYHNSQQEETARQSKYQLQMSEIYCRPIVTEIKPASAFYPDSGGP